MTKAGERDIPPLQCTRIRPPADKDECMKLDAFEKWGIRFSKGESATELSWDEFFVTCQDPSRQRIDGLFDCLTWYNKQVYLKKVSWWCVLPCHLSDKGYEWCDPARVDPKTLHRNRVQSIDSESPVAYLFSFHIAIHCERNPFGLTFGISRKTLSRANWKWILKCSKERQNRNSWKVSDWSNGFPFLFHKRWIGATVSMATYLNAIQNWYILLFSNSANTIRRKCWWECGRMPF